MDAYEQLRELLDASPTGAPASPAFDKILKLLFTPEEAGLAIHLTLFPKPLVKIAADAGQDANRAERLLDAMADKAVIFCMEKGQEKYYNLLPTIPGLFEFPLMNGTTNPTLEELGRLWDDYHREALGASFAGNPTPIVRVIPVEQSLDENTRVHPYEEIYALIEAADYIGLAQCACRVSIKACDKPTEVCLIFGTPARFLVKRGFAREIGRMEARAVLDRAEASGLVHTSTNSYGKPSFICNCCPCCCTILTCRTRLGLTQAFSPSAFEARIDEETCTGCGVCTEERCPVKAIAINDFIAHVDTTACIGCGLCATACPPQAITMVRRAQPCEVPLTTQELGVKVLTEKGKLERYINQSNM
ncbi:MAG TPA: 4Fe-4S binding protein [Deltaproteobacteria bacterium]|nr:4Fe-4S binding protein [Deltaproteobacteria bacterium]